MTETAQLALIAAIPTYLASLGALCASIAVLVQAVRNNDAKKARETVSVKIDDLKKTTDQIHTDTNANLTDMTKKWKEAMEKVEVLVNRESLATAKGGQDLIVNESNAAVLSALQDVTAELKAAAALLAESKK